MVRSNDDIENVLRRITRRADVLNRPMTREFFDAERTEGEPSALTITRRLNRGWPEVVNLVGAKYMTTDIDIGLDEVSRICGEIEREPSRADYDENMLGGAPSSITLMRNYGGSWRSVVAAALYDE